MLCGLGPRGLVGPKWLPWASEGFHHPGPSVRVKTAGWGEAWKPQMAAFIRSCPCCHKHTTDRNPLVCGEMGSSPPRSPAPGTEETQTGWEGRAFASKKLLPLQVQEKVMMQALDYSVPLPVLSLGDRLWSPG